MRTEKQLLVESKKLKKELAGITKLLRRIREKRQKSAKKVRDAELRRKQQARQRIKTRETRAELKSMVRTFGRGSVDTLVAWLRKPDIEEKRACDTRSEFYLYANVCKELKLDIPGQHIISWCQSSKAELYTGPGPLNGKMLCGVHRRCAR